MQFPPHIRVHTAAEQAMGWVTQGEAHNHNSALLSFTNLGVDNLNDLALERMEGAI